MEVYNKNRDQNNSIHDEIKEQNAKLKNASFKEKFDYFKEYYLKATIVIIAAIVIVISIVCSILTSPSDTAFAAYLFYPTKLPCAIAGMLFTKPQGYVQHILQPYKTR